MKAALFWCVMAGSSLAALPLQKRISAEALAGIQANNPMSRLVKPEAGEVKVARPDTQSILRDSTILHDGANWTIVPVGAVVFIPDKLKNRVNAQPVGKMVSWMDFLTANHAWINACEVDFEQAAGDKEFPADRTASWPRQNKVVVTVHQRGPISARLKTPPTSPTP